MLLYIILALSAFVLTLIGSRLMIVALRKRTPPIDIRVLRNQKPAEAPSGGIAVAFILIACLLGVNIGYSIILGMLLLIAISSLHEMIDIPLPIRILAQIMAITLPLSHTDMALFSPYLLPVFWDKLIIGTLWIWFINTMTAMDKADGLYAAESISIATGLCLLAVFMGAFPTPLSSYSLITAAALTGFAWWNWPPAKIRLGDAGCVPVAFLLGYLLLLVARSGYAYISLILPAYILVDGSMTMFKRIVSRRHFSVPYYYQKAHLQGRPKSTIVRLVAATNMLLIFLALRTALYPDNAFFNLAISYLCVLIVLRFFAKRPSHSTPASGNANP